MVFYIDIVNILQNNNKNNIMNFLLHTTTIELNGTVYKYERLQQYNERSHKATNKYFVDGKIVRNYQRYEVQEIFDCGSYRDKEIRTEKRWVK